MDDLAAEAAFDQAALGGKIHQSQPEEADKQGEDGGDPVGHGDSPFKAEPRFLKRGSG